MLERHLGLCFFFCIGSEFEFSAPDAPRIDDGDGDGDGDGRYRLGTEMPFRSEPCLYWA